MYLIPKELLVGVIQARLPPEELLVGVIQTWLMPQKLLVGVIQTRLMRPKLPVGVIQTWLMPQKLLVGVIQTRLVRPKITRGSNLNTVNTPKITRGSNSNTVYPKRNYSWESSKCGSCPIYAVALIETAYNAHLALTTIYSLGAAPGGKGCICPAGHYRRHSESRCGATTSRVSLLLTTGMISIVAPEPRHCRTHS